MQDGINSSQGSKKKIHLMLNTKKTKRVKLLVIFLARRL